MEFLQGFERRDGRLVARLATQRGTQFIENLGLLSQRGLPTQHPYINSSQIFELNTLEPADPAQYAKGLGLSSTPSSLLHDVFVYYQPKLTFLIPALALIRGAFPLNSSAFESIFTPRSLAALCVPCELNGQWTVEITSFEFKPKASGVPLPMREALTWAWIFQSGTVAWHSVYANALEGRMRLALPAARANVLMQGIRIGNMVYVTSLKIAALLAYDSPFDFAAGAPRSFLLHRGAQSLYGAANSYYDERDSPYSIDSAYLLSDKEWLEIAPIFGKKSTQGGEQLIPRRELANAFIKRMVTGAPWTDAFYAPLAPKAGGKQWRVHRLSGQLKAFVDMMRQLRPDAAYLKIGED